MGFTQKLDSIRNSSGISYNPKLHIINDTLFVCSNTGIYQKDLLRDGEWKLYAFKDVPIIDFVRNGSNILANAMSMTNERDSLLLLSRDGGKSFIDYTNPCFGEYGKNHLYRLAQNPLNPNSILTVVSHYGVYSSTDFGMNWKNLYLYSLFDVNCIGYHPLDTTMTFYCGGVFHTTD